MYKLRPYQQQAVDKTINYFRKKNDPAIIVLPTGAGKSIVIAELARLAQGRVLMLTHVKELVEQNFHKYQSYDLNGGVYSAGLGKKESAQKVIFASIQSVYNAKENFFKEFSLVIIDECHRVSQEKNTQYRQVLDKLLKYNSAIKILGLTATPYRLGMGWIYNYDLNGEVKTLENRYFKYCIYNLPLKKMIANKYLTPPITIDIPVTSYDFSELTETDSGYNTQEIEKILKKQKRLTPLIIKNIVDVTESYNRQGVMIFCSTVNHAKEIIDYLPKGEAEIILGDTDSLIRADIIDKFKQKKLKYLVNVSVLTTGFDAPHVDVIAILRPTESVSLYQQIVGRGLRLADGKKDCFVLDYTGLGFDIYSPTISEKKPSKESVVVTVECPQCQFVNQFWGRVNDEGVVIEHYGRKCRGVSIDDYTFEQQLCGYRFRFKICPQCSEQNDLTARVCENCKLTLVDADTKLKQARLSKSFHVLVPDSIKLAENYDKKNNSYLEVVYYDVNAESVREIFYLNNATSLKKFHVNFLRSHLRIPELSEHFTTIADVLKYQALLRMPEFVIIRKQDKFWRVTEKIFKEEIIYKREFTS